MAGLVGSAIFGRLGIVSTFRERGDIAAGRRRAFETHRINYGLLCFGSIRRHRARLRFLRAALDVSIKRRRKRRKAELRRCRIYDCHFYEPRDPSFA